MTRSVRTATLIALAIVVAGVGAAALYWRGGSRNAADARCAADPAAIARIDALAKGEVAGVKVARIPAPAPSLIFQNTDGAETSLAAIGERQGKVVLFNLWATWCAPCREEMPALDALQGKLGGRSFEVVAVNMDSRDSARPRDWLAKAGIRNLAYYADPKGLVFQTLRKVGLATGLPTTLIVDGRGCLVGHIEGPAHWASNDALALLRQVRAESAPAGNAQARETPARE